MDIVNTRKRILILDRDNDILSFVDDIMCYGYSDVHIIYDSGAVLEVAQSYKPDLIILDYLLIDHDCRVICKDFKDDEALKSIPVIVISKYRNKRVNADSYNCDALFIKPLDIAMLASRIDYLIAS